MRTLVFCFALALSSMVAKADYITMEVVTNEYDNITSIMDTLITKATSGWNSLIKETQESITFTQATSLKKYCDIDYTISAGTEIEGLLVLLQIVETESTSIVTSEICTFALEDSTYFPRIGLITMDLSKAKEWNKQVLDNIWEHEIGHLLGLGMLWERYGLVSNGAYTGENGIYGYERVGASEGVESVPVQRSLSSSIYHWDDFVLGAELMTGRMNGHFHPLSYVTAHSLVDLGYQINSNKADSLDLVEDDYDNDTTGVWIDLFHDFSPITSDQKVPVFSDGTISYKTVQFSDSDNSSSSSSTSNYYYYDDDHPHPSTWEVAITVLFAVVVVALIGTCCVCFYRRRMMKRADAPTEPNKFEDCELPPIQRQQNSHSMNAV